MSTADSIRRISINVTDLDGWVAELSPTGPLRFQGGIELDENVIAALPIPGTDVILALRYGNSLWWHRTLKVVTRLPNGDSKNYFLKITRLGSLGRTMCEGEYESLKAIHTVSPLLAPQPYGWGECRSGQPGTHFILSEFRELGEQPPDPIRFTSRLADLHRNSSSPTGKFGFHVTTCHGKLTQATDGWDDLWEAVYRKQLAHVIRIDEEKHGEWPAFQHLCKLTLDKVIPKLLGPLQSKGRSIKPCLVHGDLWDENTATDMETGEPVIFDAGSMYAHNEYELGRWRAIRHKLNNKSFIRSYKRKFPVSEPEDAWDDRNRLYSLRYNLGNNILIPGMNQRQAVFDDMHFLCEKFCPLELKAAERSKVIGNSSDEEDEEEEEEEEEEEIEEE